MKVLWAPWRMRYIQDPSGEGCFLCDAARGEDDPARLVVHRSRHVYIILNSFPYNTGHVMVASLRHVGRLELLDREERLDLIDTTSFAVGLLERAIRPDGFNVGLNLGRAAGAGIEQHLHVHVVPRWAGDTNFMPVLADVKVIPEHLQETYERLRAALEEATPGSS